MVWDYIVEGFDYVKEFLAEAWDGTLDFFSNLFTDFGWGYFGDWLSWLITVPLWVGWSIMLWKVPMWRDTYGDGLIIGLIIIMPIVFYVFARYKINKG